MPSATNEGAPLPLFSRFAEPLDCEAETGPGLHNVNRANLFPRWRNRQWVFAHSTGRVRHHSPTLYSHIGMVFPNWRPALDRPDEIRRHFRPTNSAPGCALTHMIGRCSPRISNFPVGRYGVSHSDVTSWEIQVPAVCCTVSGPLPSSSFGRPQEAQTALAPHARSPFRDCRQGMRSV